MTTHKVELTFTLTLEGEGYTSYNINITSILHIGSIAVNINQL